MKSKALAIKYTKALQAPYILCKGQGLAAERIVEIAKDNDVYVKKLENSDNGIFSLEVDDYIPETYYELFAELLSFVYALGGNDENISI